MEVGKWKMEIGNAKWHGTDLSATVETRSAQYIAGAFRWKLDF